MNPQKPKTRIVREVTPKWDEVMRMAEIMGFGEIVIKIHEKKIQNVEYRQKTGGEPAEDFVATALDSGQ